MYFDFEDHRPDTPTIPRTMSPREVVLITVNLHLLFLVAILLGPRLPFVQRILEERRLAQLQEIERQQQEQRERERARFVFMAPRVDTPAPKPPPRAEMSDIDRQARTVERAPDPQNDLPFSRGNSAERVDSAPPPRGTPTPDVTPDPTPEPAVEPSAPAPPLPQADSGYQRAQEPPQTRGPSAGVLSDAIRNVQKYAQKDGFANLQGGQNQNFGPFINFDSKGVEFGPWIARFVAQVRRNWFIPMAAMTMHGHVVVTFNVHKDGRITDVTVAKPSAINAFTLSARNAILASNPTVPLPPEYPDDRAFFTVTFFFNESPDAP
jgi:TonB family protein